MSRLLDRFVARANDQRTGVVDDAGEHPFRQIVRGALGVAAALDTPEAHPDERVALFIHPSAEFISAFFGTLLARRCVVVLSPLHPAPESAYFCADADVRTVLVSAPLREQALGFCRGLDLRDVSPLLNTTSSSDPLGLAASIAESAH